MSYAIIKTGGKQYRVGLGDEIFIETIPGEAGDLVSFEEVLAISEGGLLRVGTPTLSGASVTGKIVKQGRGKKIVVFKYKSKKGYRRKQATGSPTHVF